jgi:hypothetical protein
VLAVLVALYCSYASLAVDVYTLERPPTTQILYEERAGCSQLMLICFSGGHTP